MVPINQSEFSLPEFVSRILGEAEEGRPAHRLINRQSEIAHDLREVPDDAEYLATSGTAKNIQRIGELDRLTVVYCHKPTLEFFHAASKAPRLKALATHYFGKLDAVPVDGAPSLEHLVISWATRVVDISFLSTLPALRTLVIDDLKRLDLNTLPELPNLLGISLGGGINSTMRVESLQPLTRLPGLRYLNIYSLRSNDRSLKPLASLKHLRELKMPNYFPMQELARLAGALPNTTGPALTPFFSSTPVGCPTCHRPCQMMTGTPALKLCLRCDTEKLDRRVAKWEEMRSSTWPT
jgi:hypothetical protein